jgi:hypothetical protein
MTCTDHMGETTGMIGGTPSHSQPKLRSVTPPAVFFSFSRLHSVPTGRMSALPVVFHVQVWACHRSPRIPICVAGWGFLFDKMEQGVPVAAWKQNGRCIGGLGSWLGTGCSVSRRMALACCAGDGDGLWLPPQTRQRRLTPACSRVMSLRWCYHHQRHCKMVCPTPS